MQGSCRMYVEMFLKSIEKIDFQLCFGKFFQILFKLKTVIGKLGKKLPDSISLRSLIEKILRGALKIAQMSKL